MLDLTTPALLFPALSLLLLAYTNRFLALAALIRQLHTRYTEDPTGIVKGRWQRDIVVELFANHHIEVDYTARGFVDEADGRPPSTTRSRFSKAVRSLRSAI